MKKDMDDIKVNIEECMKYHHDKANELFKDPRFDSPDADSEDANYWFELGKHCGAQEAYQSIELMIFGGRSLFSIWAELADPDNAADLIRDVKFTDEEGEDNE